MTGYQFVLGPEFDSFEDDPAIGPSWHQDAIIALSQGLEYCGPFRGLPWLIGNQLTLIISRRDEEHLVPDVIVHPSLPDIPRLALDIEADGPPILAIEVVSLEAERDRDLNVIDPTGKPQRYGAGGIHEYLAFDPLAEFIPEQVQAWHLTPDGITPWLPAKSTGRWVSAALGISFAAQGKLLRVYAQDNNLAPTYLEVMSLLIPHDQQLAQRDRENTEREREIAALRAEIRRLRGQ